MATGIVLATGQAMSASAVGRSSATVVLPASVMASLAGLTASVSQAGGWIQVVLPLAQRGVSPPGVAATQVGSVVKDSPDSQTGVSSPGTEGTLAGAFATSLSDPVAAGNGFRVTVAFN